MPGQRAPLVVWLVVDGKPGHTNQSEGLAAALGDLLEIKIFRLPVLPFWKTLFGVLRHKNHALNFFSSPDIVIGAGHATHASLLLIKWLFKAKSIVLMKPSLPLFLFDLCLIPEHDGEKNRKQVITTKGVLNKVTASLHKQINQGVMLIGGPSKHYGWDSQKLLEQLQDIIAGMPHIEWFIANSRRTPKETSQALQNIQSEKVHYCAVTDVEPDWLPGMLSESNYAWVTEDSVSMVYEALTAQNHVGLLPVPAIKKSRVQRGVQQLVGESVLTTYRQWLENGELDSTGRFPNEAQRCAGEIVKRWQLAN